MKTFKSTAAILLSLAIVSQSIEAASFLPSSSTSPSFSMAISGSLGYISDEFTSKPAVNASPDVILIQDLHVNRSVQTAISGILKQLKRQKLLPEQIAVEGAAGPMDVASMQAEPDGRVRKEVSDYLVSQGEMPGAMHFVVTEGKGGLYGVETASVYQANLEVYQRTYEQRLRLNAEMEKLQKALPLLRRTPSLVEKANLLGKDITAVSHLVNTQTTPRDLSLTLNQVLGSIDRLKQVLPKEVSDSLLETLSASAHFYSFATMRNEDLFNNTLLLRKQTGQTTTVLITGGFHTANLASQFRKAGLSYVVITPVVRQHGPVDEKLYVERLLGHHLTPEQVSQGLDWVAMNQLQVVWGGVVQPLFEAGKTFARQPLGQRLKQAVGIAFIAAIVSAFPGSSMASTEKKNIEASLKSEILSAEQSALAPIITLPQQTLIPTANVQSAPALAVHATAETSAIDSLTSKARSAFENGSYARSAYYESQRIVALKELTGFKGFIALWSLFFAALVFYGTRRLGIGRRGSATGLGLVSMMIIAGLSMPVRMMSQTPKTQATSAPKRFETLQDAVDFILRQRPMIDGKKGLPATFYVGPNVRIPDPDRDLVVRNSAMLYDTSLAIMILDAAGKTQEAQEIIDIYWGGMYGDMDLKAQPNGANGGAFEPFTDELYYYFNITKLDGSYTPSWKFWNAHTGPNAWLARAVAGHMLKPGMNTPKNREGLRRLGDAMLLLAQPDNQLGQDTQGGVRYGPKGQFFEPGPSSNDPYFTINSENVVSALTLRWIAVVTGDGKYTRGAENLENWLMHGKVYVRSKGRFQEGMLNPDVNLFYVGANWNRTQKRWEVEEDYAEDSGGSWAISALTPEKIDARWGAGTAYKMWLSIRGKFGRTENYRHVTGNAEIAGVDFSDHFPEAQSLRTREWGKGASNGVQADALYYGSHSTNGVDVDLLNRDHASIENNLKGMSNAYAQGPGMDRPRDGATGWGWFGAPGDNGGAAMASTYSVLPYDPLLPPTGSVRVPPATGTPAPQQRAQVTSPAPQTIPEPAQPSNEASAQGVVIAQGAAGPIQDGIAYAVWKDNPGDLARFKSLTFVFPPAQAGTKFMVRILPKGANAGSEEGLNPKIFTIQPDGTAVVELNPQNFALSTLELRNPLQISIHSGKNPWGNHDLGQPFSAQARFTQILGNNEEAPVTRPVRTQPAAPRAQNQFPPIQTQAAPVQQPPVQAPTQTAGADRIVIPFISEQTDILASASINRSGTDLTGNQVQVSITGPQGRKVRWEFVDANGNSSFLPENRDVMLNGNPQSFTVNLSAFNVDLTGGGQIKLNWGKESSDGRPLNATNPQAGQVVVRQFVLTRARAQAGVTTVPATAPPVVIPATPAPAPEAPRPAPQAPSRQPQAPSAALGEAIRGPFMSQGTSAGDFWSLKDGSFNFQNAHLRIHVAAADGTKVIVQLLPQDAAYGSEVGLSAELTVRDGVVELNASSTGLSAGELRSIKQISVKSGKQAYGKYMFGDSNGRAIIQSIEFNRSGRGLLMPPHYKGTSVDEVIARDFLNPSLIEKGANAFRKLVRFGGIAAGLFVAFIAGNALVESTSLASAATLPIAHTVSQSVSPAMWISPEVVAIIGILSFVAVIIGAVLFGIGAWRERRVVMTSRLTSAGLVLIVIGAGAFGLDHYLDQHDFLPKEKPAIDASAIQFDITDYVQTQKPLDLRQVEQLRLRFSPREENAVWTIVLHSDQAAGPLSLKGGNVTTRLVEIVPLSSWGLSPEILRSARVEVLVNGAKPSKDDSFQVIGHSLMPPFPIALNNGSESDEVQIIPVQAQQGETRIAGRAQRFFDDGTSHSSGVNNPGDLSKYKSIIFHFPDYQAGTKFLVRIVPQGAPFDGEDGLSEIIYVVGSDGTTIVSLDPNLYGLSVSALKNPVQLALSSGSNPWGRHSLNQAGNKHADFTEALGSQKAAPRRSASILMRLADGGFKILKYSAMALLAILGLGANDLVTTHSAAATFSGHIVQQATMIAQPNPFLHYAPIIGILAVLTAAALLWRRHANQRSNAADSLQSPQANSKPIQQIAIHSGSSAWGNTAVATRPTYVADASIFMGLAYHGVDRELDSVTADSFELKRGQSYSVGEIAKFLNSQVQRPGSFVIEIEPSAADPRLPWYEVNPQTVDFVVTSLQRQREYLVHGIYTRGDNELIVVLQRPDSVVGSRSGQVLPSLLIPLGVAGAMAMHPQSMTAQTPAPQNEGDHIAGRAQRFFDDGTSHSSGVNNPGDLSKYKSLIFHFPDYQAGTKFLVRIVPQGAPFDGEDGLSEIIYVVGSDGTTIVSLDPNLYGLSVSALKNPVQLALSSGSNPWGRHPLNQAGNKHADFTEALGSQKAAPRRSAAILMRLANGTFTLFKYGAALIVAFVGLNAMTSHAGAQTLPVMSDHMSPMMGIATHAIASATPFMPPEFLIALVGVSFLSIIVGLIFFVKQSSFAGFKALLAGLLGIAIASTVLFFDSGSTRMRQFFSAEISGIVKHVRNPSESAPFQVLPPYHDITSDMKDGMSMNLKGMEKIRVIFYGNIEIGKEIFLKITPWNDRVQTISMGKVRLSGTSTLPDLDVDLSKGHMNSDQLSRVHVIFADESGTPVPFYYALSLESEAVAQEDRNRSMQITPVQAQQEEGVRIAGRSQRFFDDGTSHSSGVNNPGDLSKYKSLILHFPDYQAGTKFLVRIVPQGAPFDGEDGLSEIIYTVGSDGTTIVSLDPNSYGLSVAALKNPLQLALSSGSNPWGHHPLNQEGNKHADFTEALGSQKPAPRQSAALLQRLADRTFKIVKFGLLIISGLAVGDSVLTNASAAPLLSVDTMVTTAHYVVDYLQLVQQASLFAAGAVVLWILWIGAKEWLQKGSGSRAAFLIGALLSGLTLGETVVSPVDAATLPGVAPVNVRALTPPQLALQTPQSQTSSSDYETFGTRKPTDAADYDDGMSHAVAFQGRWDFSNSKKIRLTFPKVQAGVKFRLRILPHDETPNDPNGLRDEPFVIPESGIIEIEINPKEYGLTPEKLKDVDQVSIHSGESSWNESLGQSSDKHADPVKLEVQGAKKIGWLFRIAPSGATLIKIAAGIFLAIVGLAAGDLMTTQSSAATLTPALNHAAQASAMLIHWTIPQMAVMVLPFFGLVLVAVAIWPKFFNVKDLPNPRRIIAAIAGVSAIIAGIGGIQAVNELKSSESVVESPAKDSFSLDFERATERSRWYGWRLNGRQVGTALPSTSSRHFEIAIAPARVAEVKAVRISMTLIRRGFIHNSEKPIDFQLIRKGDHWEIETSDIRAENISFRVSDVQILIHIPITALELAAPVEGSDAWIGPASVEIEYLSDIDPMNMDRVSVGTVSSESIQRLKGLLPTGIKSVLLAASAVLMGVFGLMHLLPQITDGVTTASMTTAGFSANSPLEWAFGLALLATLVVTNRNNRILANRFVAEQLAPKLPGLNGANAASDYVRRVLDYRPQWLTNWAQEHPLDFKRFMKRNEEQGIEAVMSTSA